MSRFWRLTTRAGGRLLFFLLFLVAASFLQGGSVHWVSVALAADAKDAAASAPPRSSADNAELPISTENRGLFQCGQEVCDAHVSYCEMIKTDVAAIPNVYACKPLPAACLSDAEGELPSCGCFPQRTPCAFCSKINRNGIDYLQRTCVGGGAGNFHRQ